MVPLLGSKLAPVCKFQSGACAALKPIPGLKALPFYITSVSCCTQAGLRSELLTSFAAHTWAPLSLPSQGSFCYLLPQVGHSLFGICGEEV